MPAYQDLPERNRTAWEHSVKLYLPGDKQITVPDEPDVFSLEDRAFFDSVKVGENKGVLVATVIACAADESMQTGQAVDVKT